jgi:hypothetical protein
MEIGSKYTSIYNNFHTPLCLLLKLEQLTVASIFIFIYFSLNVIRAKWLCRQNRKNKYYVEELRPRRLVRVCLLVYLLVYWVVYYIVHLVREHRCK